MAKKPEPPKLINWSVYNIAAKQTWVGEAEAPDEAAAIEKAGAEFKVPAMKRMATRRRMAGRGAWGSRKAEPSGAAVTIAS